MKPQHRPRSFRRAIQTNIRITNNVMEGNGKAVLAYNASNLTITGNVVTTIRDQWSGALRFEGGVTNVTIQNNTIYDNGGPAVRIDTKSVPGLSSGFVVTNNNFYGNGASFQNPYASFAVTAGTYSGTLDVRSNWWGSAGGPSGDESGTGDGLFVGGTPVLYSPWATAPVKSPESPFDGVPVPTGVLIQAENFDQGGGGIGYQTGRTKNAGGVYRNSGVGISADNDVWIRDTRSATPPPASGMRIRSRSRKPATIASTIDWATAKLSAGSSILKSTGSMSPARSQRHTPARI